ncbi:Hypothetical_protein [Hexamita inflata]|uniref:Hypothetical_protein n=1 Tax=Hexamita inflata TaxID=28002 RepID=A0ABP1HGG4_9EUKA
MNKTTHIVNIREELTKDNINLIQNSLFTTLYILENSVVVDYTYMEKLVNFDQSSFVQQQLIILGASMVLTIVCALIHPLIILLREYQIYVKKNKYILRRLDTEDIE